MRKYISTLHEKPEHHKKRFAFVVSGVASLSIFAIWALANFGVNGQVVANNDVTKENEVSPFESLRMNMAAGLEAFKSNFTDIKGDLEVVDLKQEYNQMKDGAGEFYER